MKFNKFTFGVSVGAILGLIFAPAKGSETRKKLCDTAVGVKHTLEDWLGKELTDLDELKMKMEDPDTELDDELRRQLMQLISRAKKTYEEFKAEGI